MRKILLEEIVKELRGSLTWEVKEKIGREGYFQVISFPIEKKHLISWPAPNIQDPPRPIEMAHELIHAQLAEQVHPLFSASFFALGTPEEILEGLSPAMRAASDWFVDDRLMELCPEDELKEIKEHLKLVKTHREKFDEVFSLIISGFLQAQAVKYGIYPRKKFAKRKNRQVTRVMDAFLSVEPSKPSIGDLKKLINQLISLYTNLRVELVKQGAMEVWEVKVAREGRR